LKNQLTGSISLQTIFICIITAAKCNTMNADRAADLRDFYKSTLDNERLNCATGGPVEHLFWLTSNVAPPGNGRRSANRSTVLCLTGQGHWSVTNPLQTAGPTKQCALFRVRHWEGRRGSRVSNPQIHRSD